MRGAAFPTALTIAVGVAIAISAAIPRAAFAREEPQSDISIAGRAQFQKFAQWRDSHGASGETCLSQPGGAAEPGTRWHYHIDAATQRQCWYQKRLGAAPTPARAAKTSRAQAPDSVHSKKRARPAEHGGPSPVGPAARASTLPLTTPERETLFRRFQQWQAERPPE
jgi:hypothetical protein